MRRAGGFTLIEVLVAVFVLALGVMGAAAMQGSAARTRQHSAQTSAALALASTLAENMAANPLVARLDDGSNPYLSEVGAGIVCAGACTPAQLAAAELQQAIDSAGRSLPGGRVRVCRDGRGAPIEWDCTDAPDAPLVVKVGWRDGDAFAAGVALRVAEAP